MDYELIIKNIILPMVDNKEAVMLRKMPSEQENDITILVVADSSDVARLIGRGGSVANAIREVAGVASKIEGKRLFIKFESYDEKDK